MARVSAYTLSNIHACFGLGYSLSGYLGATYHYGVGPPTNQYVGSSTFPYSNLSIGAFYNKSPTAADFNCDCGPPPDCVK